MAFKSPIQLYFYSYSYLYFLNFSYFFSKSLKFSLILFLISIHNANHCQWIYWKYHSFFKTICINNCSFLFKFFEIFFFPTTRERIIVNILKERERTFINLLIIVCAIILIEYHLDIQA